MSRVAISRRDLLKHELLIELQKLAKYDVLDPKFFELVHERIETRKRIEVISARVEASGEIFATFYADVINSSEIDAGEQEAGLREFYGL